MKTLTFIISYIILVFTSSVFAQQVNGKVVYKNQPVEYATIHLKNKNLTIQTNKIGEFTFDKMPKGKHTFVIKSIGYKQLTKQFEVNENITYIEIELELDELFLNEIVVTGTMEEVHIKDSPVKVEVITSEFLSTNPTNNLMEAISTVNGVQECVTCGVCGTNDIHINGMEGTYSMVMIDGMPIMGSLASVYGLNGIPTEMIDQIEIIKGPSSTLYGSEAVSGVINIITKKAEKMPLISLNAFGTSHQEKNIDIAFTPKLGSVSTLIGGNYYHMNNFIDNNGDNFSDVPLSHRISLFNKWSIERKNKRVFSISGKYYYEDRFGGTSAWNPSFRGSEEVYGESIYTDRKELIGTYQLPFKEKIMFDFSHTVHNQNSYYGDVFYKAFQQISFANLYWTKKTGINSDFITGISTRNQVYDDNTPATSTIDKRFIPGIFLQNEYKWRDNLKTLTGVRWDFHKAHGSIFSPRFSLKYNPSTYTTFRVNSGTGFKVVNLFTEEHAAYSGAREVVIKELLNPETSYNITLNTNHIASFLGGNTVVDVDLFYNYFTNKIIPDYETDNSKIIYQNLDGFSINKGASFMVSQSFKKPLKISIGGTWIRTYQVDANERLPILFAPNFSGVFNISYHLKKYKTTIDYTGNIMGKMHLPTYNAPFERPTPSPWYSVQNVQFTKELNSRFSIYLSVKNVLNYTQEYSPIVDYKNPFSDYFDTSYSYGPLQKRRLLCGVRININ